MKRVRLHALASASLFTLGLAFTVLPSAGCGGGGGGSSTPSNTTTRLTIHWPARSRAEATAPVSARSFVLSFSSGNPTTGGEISFTVDRQANAAAYNQTFITPNPVKPGPTNMTLRFFADAGGSGAVVGVVTTAVIIGSDGTLLSGSNTPLGAVSVATAVKTVELPDGLSVKVGQTQQVSFTAKDASGGLVAVSPGSAQFTVTSGGDKATVTADGKVTGVAPGTANLTATVDGVTSPLKPIAVLGAVVTIEVPDIPGLKVGDTSQITFTAKDAAGNVITPSGAATYTATTGNNLVSISASGLMTAVAFGTATITVSADGVTSAPKTVNIDLGPVVTTPSGLQYQELRLPPSNAQSPVVGKHVTVDYVGYLASTGQKFDSSIDRGQPFTFILGIGQVIPGFDEGVKTMKVGGQRRLLIPAALGYTNPATSPPALLNQDLVFDINMLSAEQ